MLHILPLANMENSETMIPSCKLNKYLQAYIDIYILYISLGIEIHNYIMLDLWADQLFLIPSEPRQTFLNHSYNLSISKIN